MGLRDGQRRVEVKPDVWIWMTDKEADAFEKDRDGAPQHPVTAPVETASTEAPEQAVQSRPRTRKGQG